MQVHAHTCNKGGGGENAGGDDDPYVTSFRGIDCPTYYMTDTEQYVQLLNYSGYALATHTSLHELALPFCFDLLPQPHIISVHRTLLRPVWLDV